MIAHIHRNSDGSYPGYTDLGRYPLFYLMDDGEALCPSCANEHRHLDTGEPDGWHVIGQDVNWEDGELFCAHCNKRIESAYAEPE
jgi:hypothetical protein